MPRTKGAKNQKLKLYKGVNKALRYMKKTGRTLQFNPRPIFTETYRMGTADPLRPYYQLDSNAGGILTANIGQMPQLAQYSALYTKYKILRVRFILLPQYNTEASDGNAAIFNQSTPISNFGMGRIVTAVNNSPQQINPINENDVLEDNGCLIHSGKSKIVLGCKPVPNLLDANNVALSERNKFINFNNPVAPEVDHYGIRWWYTLPTSTTNPVNIPYFVYCKLTFQLSDPR